MWGDHEHEQGQDQERIPADRRRTHVRNTRAALRSALEGSETGVVATGRHAISGSNAVQDLIDAYRSAVMEQTIDDMPRAVREQHDHSLRDSAATLGISRGRAHQREHPDVNSRFDTLQSFQAPTGEPSA